MTDIECIALKQKAFQTYFHSLNDRQQQAVFSVNGPVLVLAGAGSGKTTAIINRIVNMIYFGDGYAAASPRIFPEDAAWLEQYCAGTEPEIWTDSGKFWPFLPSGRGIFLLLPLPTRPPEKCAPDWPLQSVKRKPCR